MNFQEKLQKGEFVITVEMEPPFGTDTSKFKEKALLLKGKVDSMVACYLLKQWGLEPIIQATCRDRNRIALQSDIISASILGIENALLLTGDYITLGDDPEAKPVFDLDSVQLLEIARGLNQGITFSGKELEGATNLFLGAVVNPGSIPLEPQLIKLEKKVKAGAQFIITQAVFDHQVLENFIQEVKRLQVPIIVGLLLLKSAKMCQFLNENVAGVEVPPHLMERMKKADDRKKECIEIGSMLVKSFKPLCQGIHFMPLGWNEQVIKIVQQAELVKA